MAVRVQADALRSFVGRVLVRQEVSVEDAATGAEVLVRTDMRGVRTHGVRFLPEYVRLFRGGCLNPQARLTVLTEHPTMALVDGESGLGHVTAVRAMELAIAKAQASGLGLVLVRNGSHFGAAGHYALLCAEAGLAGLAFSNGQPSMPAPGGVQPVVGNSPTAYGFPDPDGHGAVVFDVSFSHISGTAVTMAAERGELLEQACLIDFDGRPTNDPVAFVEERALLLPAAAHKGFGLALLAEILAGVMSGGAFARSAPKWGSGPEQAGHAFLAVSIESLMPRSLFDERLARLREDVWAGSGRLPGEGAAESERRAGADGIELDAVAWSALSELADEMQLSDELATAVVTPG